MDKAVVDDDVDDDVDVDDDDDVDVDDDDDGGVIFQQHQKIFNIFVSQERTSLKNQSTFRNERKI